MSKHESEKGHDVLRIAGITGAYRAAKMRLVREAEARPEGLHVIS